ncbi:MAG TPA: YbdK family carboxylate-amine ligase [Solirubrobacter sp.]|nr:YbdK family carboxylate-amine ligase [Solirubrobacter sp.]
MTANELRAVFDATEPLTVGLEEEVMLLDPETLDLADVASQVLRPGGRVKLELPAAQLEVVTQPAARMGDAIAELAAGRRELAEMAGTAARPAAAGVHPFAAPIGALNAGERYDAILEAYGDVARSQQVCALQVHVALGSSDATLAVYNALRGHLPELAALAANAPFHAGRDTGLASVRPLIGGLLPRQGVPPAIPSWEAFAEMLSWLEDPRQWWWELRPHPTFGTLELRVCDAQTTVAEAEAVASFAHALITWLAERYAAGEELGVPDTWRIAENRWAACRSGLEGEFRDLATGERRPVRDVLRERMEQIGCDVSPLLERNGAIRQREVGLQGVTAWLADRFLSSDPLAEPAGSLSADRTGA